MEQILGADEAVVLANGHAGGFEEQRARLLAGPSAIAAILLREGSLRETWTRWRQAMSIRPPRVIYSINTALPAVPWALIWAHQRGIPFVLDTGDLVYEMARRSGVEPAWRWPLLWAGERLAWQWASLIVVRSTCFQDYLRNRGFHRLAVIPDGYHPGPSPAATEVADLRTRLGLEGTFVVGMLGSLVWSPRLRICYGWDLLEALASLRAQPVRAVIVGDGNGRAWLERRAEDLGVRDRVLFCGRVPYDQVPTYLRLFDVALSTQTNNPPGQVRTTGKLPEYMAAGCFVLASRVGEAARLLPEPMLVPYEGEVDRNYPARLSERIAGLLRAPDLRRLGETLPAVACRWCAPAVLRAGFREALARAVEGHDWVK